MDERRAAASAFVDGLAAQDFPRLAETLAPDVCLRALLPGGPREWSGAEAVANRFARWFGDTEQHEVQDRTVDEVLGRMHLRWRFRLQAARLGAGWFVVEQLAYADAGEDGLIAGLDLLCSGYLPERAMDDAPPRWGGWDAAIRDDPSAHFEEARARCPVQKVRLADGHDAWVVLGYDAARQALNDSRISKDMLAAVDSDADVVAEGLPGPAFSRHMLNVDPPDHTRLRRLVARAFVPSRVGALEPAVRGATEDLVDQLAAGGTDIAVDLVAGFAQPLPFQVIGDLLGIPRADRTSLHGNFQVLLSAWTGDPPPEVVDASDAIVAYLGELVDAKRRHPADDLVSVLVTAGDDDRLTRQELLSSLFQLIVAGHDTTTSLIGNGVVALLDHPSQLQLLLDDPGRLPATLEELMRFSAPVPHATFRVTKEPVTLDGVEVPAHEQVLVCLAAANHDPGHFPDPEVLDITRNDGPNLGFGHGIHHCLGAPLARLEARIAFETLLGRYPQLRLAVDRDALAWTHGDGLVLRGLAALPVVLGPRS